MNSIINTVTEILTETAEPKKEVHHFQIKTSHPTSPIKKGKMKFTSSKGMEASREATRKHYESKGHTNVSVIHLKSVPHKVQTSTPEQRMKARERHWLRTGVSPAGVERLRSQGWL